MGFPAQHRPLRPVSSLLMSGEATVRAAEQQGGCKADKQIAKHVDVASEVQTAMPCGTHSAT